MFLKDTLPLKRRTWMISMRNILRSRSIYLFLFLFSALLMIVAFILQYFFHLEPCPLCILDRILVLVFGILFFIAWLHDSNKKWIRIFYSVVGFIIAGVGVALSAWHLRLMHLPPNEIPACTPSLNYLLDTFPLSEVFMIVFKSSGECAKNTGSFLGMALPGWTLIGFLILAVGSLFSLKKK